MNTFLFLNMSLIVAGFGPIRKLTSKNQTSACHCRQVVFRQIGYNLFLTLFCAQEKEAEAEAEEEETDSFDMDIKVTDPEKIGVCRLTCTWK